MILRPFDVVITPFPFADNAAVTKRRPVLVLSDERFNAATGCVLCAMITTRLTPAWPGDAQIRHSAIAGVRRRCAVRMKFHTLDQRVLVAAAGSLHQNDRHRVIASLRKHLPIFEA